MSNENYTNKNPFNKTDVSHIYDKTDFPEMLTYQKEERLQLIRSIDWYKKGLLANPVVNVFGNTGSGKTFLLYSIAREYHKNFKGFFIEISPFDVIEETKIEKLLEHIWRKIEKFFTLNLQVGNEKYRPIDLLIYRLYDRITRTEEGIENRIRYKPGLFFKQEVPIYIDFSKFLIDFKKNKHFEKILELTFAESRWNIIKNELVDLFMNRKVTDHNFNHLIQNLSRLANSLDIPICLVCDQFENLDKLDFKKPIGIFFTQLFELIRQLNEQSNINMPLFINLLNEGYDDALGQHFYTRLPKLPHGQERIFISGDLTRSQALEITEIYLQKVNKEKDNKFYPFSREEFEKHYDHYSVASIRNIRTWLIYCRHLWNVKHHGAKPIEKFTVEFQSKSKEVVGNTTEENSIFSLSKSTIGEIKQHQELGNKGLHSNAITKVESKSNTSEKEKVKLLHIDSLPDILNSALRPSFLDIRDKYKNCPESLVKLIYVFMNSLRNECRFHNMSTLENDYFSFNRKQKNSEKDTRIYVFVSTKSNRGKGFLTSWEVFVKAINKGNDYFVKCIRSKNEDVPNRNEFKVLNSKKKSHYQIFDVESHDYDWLKYLYGTIYLYRNEDELSSYDLPKLNYSELTWEKINSKNSNEKILRHFQENILKGLI